MLTLIEQIDNGNLWQSHGGIHPPESKALTCNSPIRTLPLAKEYWIPVPQLKDTCTLNYNIGDRVLKGAALTSGLTQWHLPVHAPTSGTIIAVEERVANHPSGLPTMTCVIAADGEDQAITYLGCDPEQTDHDELLKAIHTAGIAGLGGAAFPSHIKLNPASDIELVIINGVECEPYITADDLLMQEHSLGIMQGIEIIHKILQPERVVIAIEDNKPKAIQAMKQAIEQSQLPVGSIRVTVIPTKYPSGGEKQLIQIITGKQVPSGALPAQLGVLVHNVGTAYAIAEAVIKGKPLIERVVTVSGQGVHQPGNYWVAIGTQVNHVIEHCQPKQSDNLQVISGGPMMGHMLSSVAVPVLKGSNCFLVTDKSELAIEAQESPCIRCGECAQVCPAQLLPQQLFWHAKAEEYDKAASFNLRDCIECGCCSYVCPSDIPLVEYYRIAKAALKQEAADKAQAEQAKIHFEARLKRLEAEKIEREAKAKLAADKRKASMTTTDKDKVAEAMARIKRKKSEPLSHRDDEQTAASKSASKPNVAAAIARAKAKKAAQNQQAELDSDLKDSKPGLDSQSSQPVNEDSNGSTDKQAKVAAAIARAKAKKAAVKQNDTAETQNQTQEPLNDKPAATETDTKQARISAAVARAKAKKAQSASSEPQTMARSDNESPTKKDDLTATETHVVTDANTAVDDKKARIAAAVARAKAKKLANNDSISPQHSSDAAKIEQTNVDDVQNTSADGANINPPTAVDAKKARIAAAVAKAKANKTAKNLAETEGK